MPEIYLRIQGPATSEEVLYKLPEGTTWVCRAGQSEKETINIKEQVCIRLKDKEISEMHGYFEREGGTVRYTDRSRNGTKFTDTAGKTPVSIHKKTVLLSAGDWLEFGRIAEDCSRYYVEVEEGN